MSFHVTKALVAASLGIAVVAGQAHAQNDILAQWTFQMMPPTDVTDSVMGPTVAANEGTGSMFGVHASATTDWTTPAGNGSSDSYSANSWAVGDYFQFETSSAGFSNIGIAFDHTSSGTGPRDFKLQYSTDGSIFTDFGSPYQVVNGNWANFFPSRYTSFAYDLSSVASLNNDSSIYFRLVNNSTTSVNGAAVEAGGTSRIDNVTIYANFQPPVGLQPVPQRLPMAGDLVYGMSSTPLGTTLELVRGDPVENGGMYDGPGPWPLTTQFIQSVMFDNKGGTWHNAKGNLLGVDFGSSANGGTIYAFPTQGSIPLAGIPIANTRTGMDALGQAGDGSVTLTRFAGLSVNPSNNKVAVVGVSGGSPTVNTGTVIVYDYCDGGACGSLRMENGRDTNTGLLLPSTQGTAWLDDDTVIVAGVDGAIYTIDDNGTTLTNSAQTSIPDFHMEAGSLHSSIAYNPDVSPLVFAMYSVFSGGVANNYLYILDPDNNFNVLNKVDLSGSLGAAGHTAREAALDAEGNLYISAFGGVVHILEDAATNPMGIADDSSKLWYQSASSGNFVGIDIGLAPEGIPGDYNGDGRVDGGDYVRWRNHLGETDETNINDNGDGGGVGISDYTFWKDRYGNPGSGGGGLTGATVPEPTTLALVLLGLVGFGLGRRSGR